MSATKANRVSQFESARTHHLDLKAKNFENPIFTFVCFSLKAVYTKTFATCKLLFMYSFTHTNISPMFLISCEVQTRYSKTLKYSKQYIRDHISGTKVRIWICSEYDAVFDFFCIASCHLTKSFTCSFISCLS